VIGVPSPARHAVGQVLPADPRQYRITRCDGAGFPTIVLSMDKTNVKQNICCGRAAQQAGLGLRYGVRRRW
jgi:hypothetical protein